VDFTDQSTAGGGTIIGWWWDFGDGNGSISQNPVYTYTHAGIYLVCLTIITSDSCYSIWCDTLTVMPSSVDDPESAFGFTVSPNPASKDVQLTFELGSATSVTISAYDVSGRRVASIHSGMVAQGSSVTWDVSALSNGVYLVRVFGEALDVSRRVIVMH
jgi:PKD repeat protein